MAKVYAKEKRCAKIVGGVNMKFLLGCLSVLLIGACAQKSKVDPRLAYQRGCNVEVIVEGYELAEGVQPIFRQAPKYPRAAAMEGIEGCVYASFDITSKGKTRNVRVLRTVPENYGFDDATALAIRGWKFDTKAVKSAVVRMDYKLRQNLN